MAKSRPEETDPYEHNYEFRSKHGETNMGLEANWSANMSPHMCPTAYKWWDFLKPSRALAKRKLQGLS